MNSFSTRRFSFTGVLIAILVVLTIFLGFNYFFKPFKAAEVSNLAQQYFLPTPTPQPNKDIVESLSARQKILQIFAVPVIVNQETLNTFNEVNSPVISEASEAQLDAQVLSMSEWVSQNVTGAVVLFGSGVSTSSAQEATDFLSNQAKSSIELAAFQATEAGSNFEPLFFVDHEGGSVQRLNGAGFTVLPSWESLCNSDEVEAAEKLKNSFLELKEAGVNGVLGPVVDVAEDNPALGSRICSGDHQLVIARSEQFIRLAQEAGLMSVLKHFPGIGAATRDLHASFDRVGVGLEEAKVYRSLLTNYPKIGVMSSHVGVINQRPEIPCSLSWSCVNELKVNFPDVWTITDALDMKSVSYLPGGNEPKPLTMISKEAVLAGNDMLLFGPSTTVEELEEVVDFLVDEYNQNILFEHEVDRAILKLWQLKSE